MSKKNRSPWHTNAGPKSMPAQTEPEPSAPVTESVAPATLLSSISPAQLAANRANAQLSTGPRTESGRAASSKNAVKSALTGRTVLLPADDRDEYAAFLADFQNDLQPVGQLECELVQIVVDCYWRLRRIQELEYALYAHGEEQFAEAFAQCHEADRRSKIILQTHLTYEKQLRNLHIQEARIDRKRAKALNELHQLQSERAAREQSEQAEMSKPEPVAALDAGYRPPFVAAKTNHTVSSENGFVFSNSPVRFTAEAQSDLSTR
jgi:hypothetical protein